MTDLSYDDKRTLIQNAIKTGAGSLDCYVTELYDDRVVYTEYGTNGSPSTLYQVPYTIDANNAVELGDKVKVVRQTSYLAVKRAAPDIIEGLAIPWSQDTDGEHFDAETDLCLDWFGKSGRPTLYDHGLDKPGPSKIGSQIEYEERPDGIWAQAQLARNTRYRKAVDGLIEQGALGYSSGAMPHLVKMGKAGRIARWPWVELSLTPIHANLDTVVNHYTVKSARAFLEELEDDNETKITLAGIKAIAAGLDAGAATGTESLDEKAGRVSAALEEFRDHARAAADMRAKAGRVLSAQNRERISRAIANKDAVLAAYADLEALLEESDPEAAKHSRDALVRELLAFQATEARLLGVEVTAGTPT